MKTSANNYVTNTGKALKSLLFVAMAGVLFSGCVEERIDASYPVEKIEDAINYRSGINFNIPIERVQIDNQFGNIGDIQARTIGLVFRRLAEMLADVEIQRGQAGNIRLGPYQYTLNELDGVDFNYIRQIDIERVQLKISPNHSTEKDDNLGADFTFIKSVEIYIRFDDEVANGRNSRPSNGTNQPGPDSIDSTEVKDQQPDGNGANTDSIPSGPSDEEFKQAHLALSYHKGIEPMGCSAKCIDLKVHRINWKEKLLGNKSFSVLMKVNADKAPRQQFSFIGFINLSIKLNLGI